MFMIFVNATPLGAERSRFEDRLGGQPYTGMALGNFDGLFCAGDLQFNQKCFDELLLSMYGFSW
jgi:hypothetical protein